MEINNQVAPITSLTSPPQVFLWGRLTFVMALIARRQSVAAKAQVKRLQRGWDTQPLCINLAIVRYGEVESGC